MNKLILLLAFSVLIFLSCNTLQTPQTQEFEVSLKSPSVKIGDFELQLDRTNPMPGIRKTNAQVFYYPLEDAVCLQYRADFITYYQFWSAEGREEFKKHFETYLEDYENRAFGKGSRQTKRQYGCTHIYVIWQMNAITVQARASTIADFGYYITDRSPYFIVNQRETNFEGRFRDQNRTIIETSFYFTRAQANELLNFFDSENLALINPVSAIIRNTDGDYEDLEYFEED